MEHAEKNLKGGLKFSGLSYLAVAEKSEDGYAAFIPDVPGVYAFDGSFEGLKQSLADGLYIYLADLVKDSEPLPVAEARDYKDDDVEIFETFWIEPSVPDPISLEIEKIIDRSGLSYSEVSRRMKVPRSSMSRLTNPIYRGHSVDTLRKVAAALGYEMEVNFKPIR